MSVFLVFAEKSTPSGVSRELPRRLKLCCAAMMATNVEEKSTFCIFIHIQAVILLSPDVLCVNI